MPDTRVVPVPALRRIVEGATRAPSVRNTQPWRWRADSHALELYADRSRGLPTTDPQGRNLVISCGAALHHAQVVAAALGWTPRVTRHPDPTARDLLARIELSPAPAPAGGAEALAAVQHRCTDRRRFTTWPVPEERLAELAAVADQWGTRATPLTDVSQRYRAERLIARAADQRAAHRAASDGAHHHRREDGTGAELEGQDVEPSDGLVLLFDTHDDPASWLRAGEGLSALWLTATTGGLSLVPLSRAIEVDQTREDFRLDVLRGSGHPLLLARVGWQEISLSELTRTPRRPLDEVLEVR